MPSAPTVRSEWGTLERVLVHEPGEEFNGGRVEIAGLELTGGASFSVTNRIEVPLSLVYTYTETAFQTDFASGFSQWGTVRAGDELHEERQVEADEHHQGRDPAEVLVVHPAEHLRPPVEQAADEGPHHALVALVEDSPSDHQQGDQVRLTAKHPQVREHCALQDGA